MKNYHVKEIVIAFNGIFNIIFGTAIITKDLLSFGDYREWAVGFGVLLFGILCVFFSNLIHFKK